jgi:hypothetical protein
MYAGIDAIFAKNPANMYIGVQNIGNRAETSRISDDIVFKNIPTQIPHTSSKASTEKYVPNADAVGFRPIIQYVMQLKMNMFADLGNAVGKRHACAYSTCYGESGQLGRLVLQRTSA